MVCMYTTYGVALYGLYDTQHAYIYIKERLNDWQRCRMLYSVPSHVLGCLGLIFAVRVNNNKMHRKKFSEMDQARTSIRFGTKCGRKKSKLRCILSTEFWYLESQWRQLMNFMKIPNGSKIIEIVRVFEFVIQNRHLRNSYFERLKADDAAANALLPAWKSSRMLFLFIRCKNKETALQYLFSYNYTYLRFSRKKFLRSA